MFIIVVSVSISVLAALAFCGLFCFANLGFYSFKIHKAKKAANKGDLERFKECSQKFKTIIKYGFIVFFIFLVIFVLFGITGMKVVEKYKYEATTMIEEKTYDDVSQIGELLSYNSKAKVTFEASDSDKVVVKTFETKTDFKMNKMLRQFLFIDTYCTSKIEYVISIPKK